MQRIQDRIATAANLVGAPLSDLELVRAIYRAAPFLPTLPGVSQHQLAHALRRLPPSEARRELDVLQRASASPRLASAYQAYFSAIAQTPPLPSLVRHALVDGVVTPRHLFEGDTSGVIAGDQALLVARVWNNLPTSVRRNVSTLLTQASSGTERALLLEAVGARWQEFRRGDTSSLADFDRFASEIRGVSPAALVRATSLVDRDRVEATGGHATNVGIVQPEDRACTQIVELVVRAEADPIFAWDVTRRLPYLGPMPHAVPARELEDPGIVLRTAHGGRWNVGQFAPATDEFARVTNRAYTSVDVPHPNAERRIVALLDLGVSVPVGIAWVPSGRRHATVAVGLRGQGAEREVRIFDPATGRGSWVPLGALVSGGELTLGRLRARAEKFYDSEVGRQGDVNWDPNELGGRVEHPLTEPLR